MTTENTNPNRAEAITRAQRAADLIRRETRGISAEASTYNGATACPDVYDDAEAWEAVALLEDAARRFHEIYTALTVTTPVPLRQRDGYGVEERQPCHSTCPAEDAVRR